MGLGLGLGLGLEVGHGGHVGVVLGGAIVLREGREARAEACVRVRVRVRVWVRVSPRSSARGAFGAGAAALGLGLGSGSVLGLEAGADALHAVAALCRLDEGREPGSEEVVR